LADPHILTDQQSRPARILAESHSLSTPSVSVF
jgi:hypothetical protein